MLSRRTSIRRLIPVAACLILTWTASGCQGGADLGAACETQSDCADELQCFDGVCVPQCTRHTDCGDGHICRADGVCEVVESTVGHACDREMDCGPGQACVLDAEDIDGNGLLTSSCQLEAPGGVLDSTCRADADCRMGTCVIGRCVSLCVADEDCPVSHRCTIMPRELSPTETASFYGCLPARGNIVYDIPFTLPYQRFFLPVPGRARSVALVAEIDDPAQLVGVGSVKAPDGTELYVLPPSADSDEYFANPVRSFPTPAVSTLVLPQTAEDDALVPGAYQIELGSYRGIPEPQGTDVPRVTAIYKLDDTATLDVHFYFLDLADHPCVDEMGGETLDATSAQVATGGFQTEFLRELNVIFARAGIVVGNVTYEDVAPKRPDLDGLDASRLGDLLALSNRDGGASVFFTRTISPAGLQTLAGGPPGPPGVAGTRASGIAVSAATLCYRSWTQLARTTAHELARSLGLQRSVEPDGHLDALIDTDDTPQNLMYFSESGGTNLSLGQRQVLRVSPAMR
ncbi:MAG: hypothetical protein KC464_25820 [Myxococcales bacterium]|nr:hypothetical protein [Myxococcales bacterium]